MRSLNKQDLARVVGHLPADLVGEMKESAKVSRTLYVAGGFVRAMVAREDPKDIDVMGPTPDRLELVAERLKDKRPGARLHKTQNAITLLCQGRLPVQFITRWLFTDPGSLLESLDFTVCQAAVWWNPTDTRWMNLCSDRFYEDLAAKRLVYTRPDRDEDAGGSLLRVRKYLGRGYGILIEDLAAVVTRIHRRVQSQAKPEDQAEDTERRILGELRLVDPLAPIEGLEMAHECLDDGRA